MNTIRLETLNPDPSFSNMKATGMKEHRTGFSRHCSKIVAVLAFSAVLHTAPCTLAETVVCDETTLSVTAADMKAEDLLKAVGETCGIKIVVRGDVFTEDTYSVQFENMPIRTGLERILRVVNLPNHMMHFEEANSRKRVREIDLVGKKGGERQLTSGEPSVEPKRPDRQTRNSQPQTEKPGLGQHQEEELQEKAIELMDEILDAQTEDANKPEPAEVPEMPRQELPEETPGQIPVTVPPGPEQQPKK
jgi:hypothetical protein